ncbi:hypothetical protein EK904_006388 [Melospiza melodia maxima]|nr:hypothetical protein EK904_006388 [Melospiza melodia maxima]
MTFSIYKKHVTFNLSLLLYLKTFFFLQTRIWESGRVGKTREKEVTASTLVACSPCFSHQHWPELTVDSAATCDDGEERNGNCTSAYLILPFVKFLGQQKDPALIEPRFSSTKIYPCALQQAPEQPLLASPDLPCTHLQELTEFHHFLFTTGNTL